MNRMYWLILLFSIITTAMVAVFLTLYLEPFHNAPLFVNSNNNTSQTVSAFTGDRVETRLYFLTADHQQLAEERREIPATTAIKTKVEEALKEWLAGPKSPGLILPAPSGTELKGVFWSDNDRRMYINFSEALIKNAPGHALAEWATIYALVKTTAAQSIMIEEVQILVNGEPVSSDLTIWDWSLPFKDSDALVRMQ